MMAVVIFMDVCVVKFLKLYAQTILKNFLNAD
jgi:hypothetical protein